MSIILEVLQIVAPVFILAAIGFIWVKLGGEYRVQFVTRLAMTLSVPCLIFVSLMKTSIDPAALSELVVASVVSYALLTLVVFAIVKLAGLEVRTFLAPLIFGNTGNLGMPLALFAFGETGLGCRCNLCSNGGDLVHIRDLAGLRRWWLRKDRQGTDGRGHAAWHPVFVYGLDNTGLGYKHP